MNQLTALSRDALLAHEGDAAAAARLARRGVPWLAKRLLPGAVAPLVDGAAGLYDAVVRPELVPDEGRASAYDEAGIHRFVSWLESLQDGVIVIVGATGQGKTTTMAAIAERWVGTASRMQIVGVPAANLVGTPLEPFEWPRVRSYMSRKEKLQVQRDVADRIDGLPRHSVLLIPDSGLYMDSRDYGGDAESTLTDLFQVARHKAVRVVLDVQYTSLLAKRAFLTRALIYKPLGVTFEATERDGLVKLARISERAFDELPTGERKKHAYVFCSEVQFRGLVPVTPPPWYSDSVSKSHADDDEDRPSVVDAAYEVLD